jgi:hypothetical protein
MARTERGKSQRAASEHSSLERSLLARAGAWVRDALRTRVRGDHAEELAAARATIVLSRVVALAWVAALMMPFAIFIFVGVVAPAKLPQAVTIVGMAEVAVFVIRALVKRGVFDRTPQLAPLVLVGLVFGPVASSVCELIRAQGDFFFAYFLIAIAFISLFPVEVSVVLAICAALFVSYASALLFRPRLELDTPTATNLLYLVDITVLAIVFNRILTALFFDERLARIGLRGARDALVGEMAIAQEIQSLLLPPKDVTLAGHTISGQMLPADEVGGDYYDVVDTGGRRFFAIGDVSGHGVTSGLTMMMARSCLVGALAAERDMPLDELYRALNFGLRRNLERMPVPLHMTFVLIEDLGGGRYRAVGSHLPMLVWRKSSATVEEIEVPGVWLGVVDEIPPEAAPSIEMQLAVGDQLLLYTDGIVEAFAGDEMFGFDRLRNIFAAQAPRGPVAIVPAVLRAVINFADAQEDDMTLLAIQYTGEEADSAAA